MLAQVRLEKPSYASRDSRFTSVRAIMRFPCDLCGPGRAQNESAQVFQEAGSLLFDFDQYRACTLIPGQSCDPGNRE
jgi:hypothetical protein